MSAPVRAAAERAGETAATDGGPVAPGAASGAAPRLDPHAALAAARGRTFHKLCGSGNDFVFFDARTEPAGALADPAVIRLLTARATGIGADGVVFLEPGDDGASVRMAYYNADGSRASMCGNAALCTTRLAVELGAADPAGFVLATDVGPVPARLRDGLPEIELPPVRDLAADAALRSGAEPGERRLGYVNSGVPHLVVRVDAVEQVPLDARGRTLRFDAALPDGANVNWVAPAPGGGWRMRTYERGVEGETLACGTGAVACAAVLAAWGEAGEEATIVTSSGRPLVVRQPSAPDRGPALRGEGRIVFAGRLGEVA